MDAFNREDEIAMIMLETHGSTSHPPTQWKGWKHAEEDYCPEWLDEELGEGTYVTVLDYSLLSEVQAPEGYERVRQYAAGEKDCPYCGNGTGEEHNRAECPLCEGNGTIYQGAECQVVVFKEEEPEEVESEFDGPGMDLIIRYIDGDF